MVQCKVLYLKTEEKQSTFTRTPFDDDIYYYLIQLCQHSQPYPVVASWTWIWSVHGQWTQAYSATIKQVKDDSLL